MRRIRPLFIDGLLTAMFLGLLWLAVDRLAHDSGETLTGRPRVVDGDTLAIGRERLRLSGIDAPEHGQTCERHGDPWNCGRDAEQHLIALIDARPVECKIHGQDRYGRRLAVCRADETDLNARMVEDGFAIAFGGYEAQEAAARVGGAGLWAGTFDQPRDWRARHGGMAETPHMTEDIIRALRRRIEALWTTR